MEEQEGRIRETPNKFYFGSVSKYSESSEGSHGDDPFTQAINFCPDRALTMWAEKGKGKKFLHVTPSVCLLQNSCRMEGLIAVDIPLSPLI